jgi:predicted HicB family RNase H-like nuclease
MISKRNVQTMKSTLAVRAFPPELNKAAKMEALKRGVSLRQFIIDAVKSALRTKV